jgi:hypothetical protein
MLGRITALLRGRMLIAGDVEYSVLQLRQYLSSYVTASDMFETRDALLDQGLACCDVLCRSDQTEDYGSSMYFAARQYIPGQSISTQIYDVQNWNR